MNFEYYYKKIGIELNFLVLKLLRKQGVVPPPRLVVWDSTRRCNLNCKHCGAKNQVYEKELSTSEIKKIIDEIADYGARYFAVTGGEPFIRSDLLEVFGYAKSKGLLTTLATNGFFINKENIKNIVDVVGSVQVSLDGPEKIHNQIRNNDKAFESVISAVKLLKENKVKKSTISSVITSFNFNHFEELAKIVEDLGVSMWKILLVMPIGNAEGGDQFILNNEQFVLLMEGIKKYKKKWKGKIIVDLGENSAYLGKYDRQIRTQPFFCPVGLTACCIGVDGKMRGCPEQPDVGYFVEGDILTEGFKNIWEERFKKYRTGEETSSECKKCPYKKKCRGGCWIYKIKNKNCTVREYSL